jgi:hypothetical protein
MKNGELALSMEGRTIYGLEWLDSCNSKSLILVRLLKTFAYVSKWDFTTNVIIPAVTDFTVTQERSEVMTFATPITEIYNSFFVKNPADVPNYQAYTQSFHWKVWLMIFLVVFLGALMLHFLIW